MNRNSGHTSMYASEGKELVHYGLDIELCALVRKNSVTLPADVQYAWAHPSHRYLYVATSNGGPGFSGDCHYVSVLHIDAATGALHPHGPAVPLQSRPIHITVDIPGRHALISYNDPSGVTVHGIDLDGSIGDEVKQRERLDFGIYAHQTRITPSNQAAIVVTRGNDATTSILEDPGALKLFRYRDGQLTPEPSFAPAGGYGYGPRHLDFHPTLPRIYVSLERQNTLHVYKLSDGVPDVELLCRTETLADPANIRRAQRAGAVHVHPNGRFVYVANRASGTRISEGRQLFVGGENSIAVCAIDQRTGETTLIQHMDTRGKVPRTFAIDPSGRVLIVANLMPALAADGPVVRAIPPSLALFRVGEVGKLVYVRQYDADASAGPMFWMGMLSRY